MRERDCEIGDARACLSPCPRTVPEGWLKTKPTRPSSFAFACVCLRKKTPWTRPETSKVNELRVVCVVCVAEGEDMGRGGRRFTHPGGGGVGSARARSEGREREGMCAALQWVERSHTRFPPFPPPRPQIKPVE
jgi:hypothetical protein